MNRNLILLLTPLIFINHVVLAQSNNNLLISNSELDFYLLQAFNARTAEQRIAINHIGIQLVEINGDYIVSAALEGYPAHLAGIERGDRIESVNGQPYHPVYSFNNAKTDDSFAVEYSRRGSVHSIQMTPVFENLYDSYRTSTLDSIQIFSSGNKTVGYIRLWGLSRSTADLFTLEHAISVLDDCDGIIVDLRNSYGYLSTKHLDLFIRNGRGYFSSSSPDNVHSNIEQNFVAINPKPYLRPLAVLINSETRGGSELLAYGLAKIERVITIGENTAGEIGHYQPNTGDSINRETQNLRYVPADKLLIDGLTLEEKGIIPEETVNYPFEQSSRSDPQFETAVSLLLGII